MLPVAWTGFLFHFFTKFLPFDLPDLGEVKLFVFFTGATLFFLCPGGWVVCLLSVPGTPTGISSLSFFADSSGSDSYDMRTFPASTREL